jgi:hypothetical protein
MAGLHPIAPEILENLESPEGESILCSHNIHFLFQVNRAPKLRLFFVARNHAASGRCVTASDVLAIPPCEIWGKPQRRNQIFTNWRDKLVV